jgi:CheY-like chemotaxis protein
MLNKILIIDDEEVWGSLTRRMLAVEMPGCVVEMANNGKLGIQKAQRLKPDVIVLDVMLPGENGWEIAATLKRTPETADIPIIVASGAGSPYASGQHVEEELVDDYIRKPFDIDMLLTALRKVTSREES